VQGVLRLVSETKVSEFRYRRWVSPFGDPRIKASSQLLVAYRSVVRPS
jgi:hypothetical protein